MTQKPTSSVRLDRKSSTTGRQQRAVESFQCAANAIGPIERGMSLFALTRGQWSMIDAILHCLDCVGPSHVSVWTWTVAEYEVQVLTRLMRDERLTGARLVIDGSARAKNKGIIADWRASFGSQSVRYVMNHAKLSLIESASGLRLLLRGSMNLNFNPRFEQFDLTEGGPAFDMVKGVEDSLPVLADDCPGEDIYSATSLSNAFESKTLNLFKPLKVWAK